MRAILCQTAGAGEVEVQDVIGTALENHLSLIVYDTIISSHGSPVVDDGLSCQSSPCIHRNTAIVIYCGVMGCAPVKDKLPPKVNDGIVGYSPITDILSTIIVNRGVIGDATLDPLQSNSMINGGIVGYAPVIDILSSTQHGSVIGCTVDILSHTVNGSAVGCTSRIDILIALIHGGVVGNATLIDILIPSIQGGVIGCSSFVDILFSTINGCLVGNSPHTYILYITGIKKFTGDYVINNFRRKNGQYGKGIQHCENKNG
ncbi:Uncharacterised protein [Yersinia frederiksenii]|nr:Uncharacterised protein [Yersinia frederiksenii]